MSTAMLNECLSASRTLCIRAKKTTINFSFQPSNISVQCSSHTSQPVDVFKHQTLNSNGTSWQLPTLSSNTSDRTWEPQWCEMLFPDVTSVYFLEQTCLVGNGLSLCEPLSSCGPLRGSYFRRTGCETVRDFLLSLRAEKGLVVRFEMETFGSPYILRLEIHQFRHGQRFDFFGNRIDAFLWKLQNYLFSPTFGEH